MRRLIFSLLLIFVILSGLTQAGVYIESVEKDVAMTGGSISNAPGQLLKIYIDTDRVRMDSPGMMGKEMSFIYRVDKNAFWYIDHSEQTYTEMTQKDLEKIKIQVDKMKKMMEEQMNKMPAEQRKMMQSMMGKQMSGMKGEEAKYKLVKKNIKIERWNTNQYAGYIAGEKTEEVWTCPLEEFGMTKSDFSVLEKMSSFFSAIGTDEEIFPVHSEDEVKDGQFPGAPVKTVQYDDGQVTSESLVKKVENRSFDPDLFELPNGYKKTKQQFGSQGGDMFGQ